MDKMLRSSALEITDTSIYIIYLLRTGLKFKKMSICILQHKTHVCIFFYKIPTRVPICKKLQRNHRVEAHRYPTYGTTLTKEHVGNVVKVISNK